MSLPSFALFAAALAAAGCAAVDPFDGIEAKATSARTRAQHLDVASLFAQRAEAEQVAAGRHQVWAVQERQVWDALNRGRPYRTEPTIMLGHCEALVAMHAKAAQDSAVMSEAHRRMAFESARREAP